MGLVGLSFVFVFTKGATFWRLLLFVCASPEHVWVGWTVGIWSRLLTINRRLWPLSQSWIATLHTHTHACSELYLCTCFSVKYRVKVLRRSVPVGRSWLLGRGEHAHLQRRVCWSRGRFLFITLNQRVSVASLTRSAPTAGLPARTWTFV